MNRLSGTTNGRVMPKYTVTWKDPDAFCREIDDSMYGDNVSDDEFEKLQQLGFDEYVTIVFDTDTMTVEVKKD